MQWFVVDYACGESQIVQAESVEAALSIDDDLGCKPRAVYRPDQVWLTREAWTKNGQLRCSFVLREGP
jgi:hypothetical protein